MKNTSFLCCLLAAGLFAESCGQKPAEINGSWTGTWGTAVQLTEPHNMPPAPGLSQNTIRQRFKVSIGGDSLKLRLSNEFGDTPLKIIAVSIAPALEGSKIDAQKAVKVKFSGSESLEIPVGKNVFSDAFAFKTSTRQDLAVTIAYDAVPEKLTGHPGSRTTSYILEGNQIDNASFEGATTTDHWYSIERLDTYTPEKSASVAIIGNSITDGRGSTTNAQNRWPDIFAERLLNNPETKNLGVLNMGIGGNCVIFGGLGPTASTRFERDVLSQTGVKYVIIFEGVNDIGPSRDTEKTKADLIEHYTKMVDAAHAKGLKVFGATITPLKKCFYMEQGSDEKEKCRLEVNEWIRTSGKFDGVIDFSNAICGKETPDIMDESLHDNDYLHPNAQGHKTLGEFVDLNLFK